MMKTNKFLGMALALASSAGMDSALAADVPNKTAAAALKSLIDSERAVYTRLIEQRSGQHGCKAAKDQANLDADLTTIPNVADFQRVVMTAVKAIDGGKYAAAGDVAALASKAGGMPIEAFADLLNAYADTSRTTYTKTVIARAQKSKCGKPSEEWAEENGLPLPAQYTRAMADGVRKAGLFAYSLLSEWPINKQNSAKTDFEKKALKDVQNRRPVYAEEALAGKRYFSAAYADVATNAACTSCHNDHAQSPKKDFKLNDVMGGMVVRIPLN